MDIFKVKLKLLHCNKQDEVINKMYGDEYKYLQSQRARCTAFLHDVVLDNRVDELETILNSNEFK